jgi:hypothetical protein
MGKHNHSVPLTPQSPSKLPNLTKNQRRDLQQQVSSKLVYMLFPSGHNTHACRPSAELADILASGGEQRWNPTSALSRYLPRAHIELACHRSRATHLVTHV